MTRLKLAIVSSGCEGFSGRGRIEHYAEDVLVEAQMFAQPGDAVRFSLENDVHVKARVKLFIGNAHEILLIHLLDGFNAPAARRDLSRDLVDNVLNALFLAGRIQNKQTFVSFHFLNNNYVATAPL